jgi:hypothetical protein
VTKSNDTGASTSYTYSLASPSWTDPSGAYTATLDKFDRQLTVSDPIHGASQFSPSASEEGTAALESGAHMRPASHSA